MDPGDKIPSLVASEPIDKPCSGRREARRGFAIIAEFAETTERLNGAGQAVSIFGSARIDGPAELVRAIFERYKKHGFEPSPREREARLDR